MMTDGNSDTVTKAYERSKENTNKVTTADDALKGIQDAVTTTAEGLKQIPDSVETANEYLKAVPGVAITTDAEAKESQIEEEFVHVPKHLKRYVIGIVGSVVKNIRKVSGATVVDNPMDEEGFTVTGNKEQRACAKKLISQKVEGAQITHKENALTKVSYYIDEWNIPSGCKLKLEQIAKEDGIPLSQSFAQYRIKPVEMQESYSANDDPTYMSNLECDTLESLRMIKIQMETERHLKAEIWCHFGTVIVRQHIKEDKAADGEWTIEEAASNLRASRGNQWKTAFKGGVNLNEKVLQEHAFDKTPKDHEDYSSRYDLTFLMPNGRQIKLWVWVTKKDLGKKLEDIPIPSGYVKNALEEIHFKDELTRSRCRGWLVLPYQRYLRADILFPGCEFDCRLTITGHSDRALETGFVPDEDTRRTLTRYLSELTIDDGDDFGLRLPEEKLPDGYELSYMCCSQIAMYGFMPGFTIVLSKDISKDTTTAKSRVSSAFYLVCDKWEDLLNTRMWEPEALVKKLPEFFRFVKKVQGFVLREMKETGLTQKVPPEILARGSLALKAYTKALADGKTFVKRVPIMLIGQDRAGKTSLKKSLRGICFDPEEDSTVGIDVDPSWCKITTETWRTGTTEKDTNPNAAISFDHHTAMWVAENLTREGDSTLLENSTDEFESTPGSKVTETPTQICPTEPSRDAEHIQLPNQSRDTLGGDTNHVPLRSSEQDQEDFDDSPSGVPEEVAVVTETLLQETWEDNRKEVYSTLWDFAGQSVYYETHPLFLTARAIYCLVYDLSLHPHERAHPLVKQGVYRKIQDNSNLKTNFDYLDFWMMSVASMARNQNGEPSLYAKSEVLPKRLPPVFLVCTHADTRYDDGRNPKELARELLGFLKSKPYGAHLHDVFTVDNTKSGTESECSEVKRLRQEVLVVAKELPYINEAIPIRWLKFEKAINALKEVGKKYISFKEAKEIASNACKIAEDLEIKTLIDYLHDLRTLIHFDDSPELNKLVVLDPQWLIDVFKKVITVRPYDCKEKKFEELWCKLEREGILEEELLAHVWGPLHNSKESYESLARIMEKFSLLCPWPSETSKSFLVPSMLKTRPQKVTELVSCARLPSLFINFASGLVPPGLFHRFVLQFFQWGSESFLKPIRPQLFRNFVRFVTAGNEVCSVIFVCHNSSLEVVIVGEDNHELAAFACAGVVCTQVGLMLESMRNEFHWLSNMRYEMSVLCPVCCQGRAIDYCRLHDVEGCSEEHCLHFWTLSELCSANETVTCPMSPSAPKITVHTQDFAPWFVPSGHQLTVGEMDSNFLFPGEGHEEKALALPNNVLESLCCVSNDSKEVVAQFTESLQLEEAVLEEPNSETKALIRCFARNAVCLNRLDVVKYLRKKLPAGTTGPLLPEQLVVQKIPLQQIEDLTHILSGGDEWKRLAEKLGLTPDKIRYLDQRVLNPADAFLAHLAKRRPFTVGELYDALCECDFPVLADKL